MVTPRFQSHVVGTGPIVIEFWLDYICPFCKKFFNQLHNTTIKAAEKDHPGKFSWVFRHQTQPWHPQGGYLTEVGIAVGLVAPDKFWAFSDALFQQQVDFFDEAVVDKSRNQIISDVVDLAAKVGVPREPVLEAVKITAGPGKNAGPPIVNDVKYYTRLSRQNGIHVSPTVVIDGTVDPQIDSSFSTEQWQKKLDTVAANVLSTAVPKA